MHKKTRPSGIARIPYYNQNNYRSEIVTFGYTNQTIIHYKFSRLLHTLTSYQLQNINIYSLSFSVVQKYTNKLFFLLANIWLTQN